MADEIRRLIRVRNQKGAHFKRDGFGKKKQLSGSWRKPRGQHNKQREQKKAKGPLPKPGFGSPVPVRGMHPSGFFEVLVHGVGDLEGLDPGMQAIRIASAVGNRKRAAIQEKAITAGLRVLNAKAVQPVKKPASPAEAREEEQEPVRKEPARTEKVPAAKKNVAPKAGKDTPQAPKKSRTKKTTAPDQAKAAEKPEKKKEKTSKVTTAKEEADLQEKPKKPEKTKTGPVKEAASLKKTKAKPAAKPKKKAGTKVKDNE